MRWDIGSNIASLHNFSNLGDMLSAPSDFWGFIFFISSCISIVFLARLLERGRNYFQVEFWGILGEWGSCWSGWGWRGFKWGWWEGWFHTWASQGLGFCGYDTLVEIFDLMGSMFYVSSQSDYKYKYKYKMWFIWLHLCQHQFEE